MGVAGAHIRTLDAIGITAVGLAEQTRLTPNGRSSWEARLAPWRGALCLQRDDDLADALKALRGSPGAIVISPENDTMCGSPGFDAQATQRDLPAGVLDAPPEAFALLHALATQTGSDVPVPYMSDPRTGVHVIGGFHDPIVGKEEICVYFAERLRQAREQLGDAERTLTGTRIAAEQTCDTLIRAQAATLVG